MWRRRRWPTKVSENFLRIVEIEEEEEEEEEVEEEEEKEEKGSEKTGLSEDEKQHRLDWDSLGVLGLASKLSRDTKSR